MCDGFLRFSTGMLSMVVCTHTRSKPSPVGARASHRLRSHTASERRTVETVSSRGEVGHTKHTTCKLEHVKLLVKNLESQNELWLISLPVSEESVNI